MHQFCGICFFPKMSLVVVSSLSCVGLAFALYKWKQSRVKSTMVNGIVVKWTDPAVCADDVQAFAPLTRWSDAVRASGTGLCEEQVTIADVTVLSVFKPGKRILFLHSHVHATMPHNGQRVALPGIVTFRGISVAALLWCRKDDAVHILLVEQPRVAAGQLVWEAPAGMLDEKTLSGAMFDEIKEETGLVVGRDMLKPLGNAFSSPGLLDEQFAFYSAHCVDIEAARAGGNAEEDEVISKVKLFSIDNAPLQDAKTICLLEMARRAGVF